jgi:AcrR family transcriptional regulator
LRRVDAAAVDTPWGPASELKKRKLQPGSGTPRSEVARNQRERLFGAVVTVVSDQGYAATTVADVLAVCGVSRSDFYRHFANKADCLTAAAEAMIEPTLRELRAVGGQEAEAGEPSAQAVFERFIELVGTQPAAVCFVELHGVGERGEEVADHGFRALAELAAEAAWVPPGDEAGSELVPTLLGGVRKLLHTRLYRRRESELRDLAPGLWRWLAAIEPPPRPLAPRRQRPAPGPQFEGYTPAERVARAVAAVVAERGFGAMSTDDIAARAAISLSTFYDHFADKEDAVLAALEMSGAQIMALAVPAARRAGDWEQGVRALYEAMCAYLAAEPAMAELALVGVYGAGPRALARRDRVIDSLAEMLAPGYEQNPEAPAISAEAAAATVYALMREQLRRKGPRSLPAVVPLATYITLVGFVGPERACAVANGEGASRR